MKSALYFLAGLLTFNFIGCSMGGGSQTYMIVNQADDSEEVMLSFLIDPKAGLDNPNRLQTAVKLLKPGECVSFTEDQFTDEELGVSAGKGGFSGGYKLLCGSGFTALADGIEQAAAFFGGDTSKKPECEPANYAVQDKGAWGFDDYQLVKVDKVSVNVTCVSFDEWAKSSKEQAKKNLKK